MLIHVSIIILVALACLLLMRSWTRKQFIPMTSTHVFIALVAGILSGAVVSASYFVLWNLFF